MAARWRPLLVPPSAAGEDQCNAVVALVGVSSQTSRPVRPSGASMSISDDNIDSVSTQSLGRLITTLRSVGCFRRQDGDGLASERDDLAGCRHRVRSDRFAIEATEAKSMRWRFRSRHLLSPSIGGCYGRRIAAVV